MIPERHRFLGLQIKSDYWGKGEKENWTSIKQKMAKPALTETKTQRVGKRKQKVTTFNAYMGLLIAFLDFNSSILSANFNFMVGLTINSYFCTQVKDS